MAFIYEKKEISFGENGENLPSIIKILMNVYKEEGVEHSENIKEMIELFFKPFKDYGDDGELREFINTSKGDSEGRILDKLNMYFP